MVHLASRGDTVDIIASLNHALEGRYTVERELGRGGMAIVYLAEDVALGRKVAIKVLRPELAASLGHERFAQEIKVTANLQHPNILPLHESGEADGFLFYVMPFVEGESLRDRLERVGHLPVDEALRYIDDVAAALSHAHDKGIVHRDIKPENIMLSGGRAIVADFGIARAVEVAADDRLTERGVAVGTPKYMSPEQWSAPDTVDARADIYALGCVLFEMVGGRAPFEAETPQELIAKHLAETLPDLRSSNPSIPKYVKSVVEKAMAKLPADRFQAASQLADALRTHTVVSTIPYRLWARRSIRVAAIAGVMIVGAIGGVVAWTAMRGPGDAAADRVAELAAIPVVNERIMVVPARTRIDTLQRWRKGTVDLVSNIFLADTRLPIRAVDWGSFWSAWERATDNDARTLSRREMVVLAASLGAGRVLEVNILEAPSGLQVTGELIDSAGRQQRRIMVPVDADVGRALQSLVVQLFAPEIGDEDYVEALDALEWEVVQLYLSGVEAHRRGKPAEGFEFFKQALEMDSTFALAAFRAGGGDYGPLFGANRFDVWTLLAWRHRENLPPADAALLTAYLVGATKIAVPGLVTRQEHCAFLEESVREWPDHVGLLQMEVGCHGGRGPWSRDSPSPVVEAKLRRIEVLDPSSRPWDMTLWARRDPDFLRAVVESPIEGDGAYDIVSRWQAAMVLGDTKAADTLFGHLQDLTINPLGTLLRFSLVLGIPLGPVEQVVSTNPNRGPNYLPTMQVARGRIAEFVGDPYDWRPRSVVGFALALADSAFRPFFAPLAARLDSVWTTSAPPVDSIYSVSQRDALRMDHYQRCVSELWRVWIHGDTTETRRRMVKLEEQMDVILVESWCAPLLAAMLEDVEGHEEHAALDTLVAGLDSRRWIQIVNFSTGPNTRRVLVATMLDRVGRTEDALRILRPPNINNAPSMWSYMPLLKLKGELELKAGHPDRAQRDLCDYLVMRDQPDPGVMAEEVEEVRLLLVENFGRRELRRCLDRWD